MLKEIAARRSVRKYRDTTVTDEQVLQILESARLAPSGSNTQPWRFIVVRSEETRSKIAEVSHRQKWMTSAPVHIVCVGDLQSRLTETAELVLDENSSLPELKQVIRDTTIAVEHMVLEAERLGLSTCWVAWFTQEEIRPVLQIPSDKYVLAVLPIGYGAETPDPRPRMLLEDLVRYESW